MNNREIDRLIAETIFGLVFMKDFYVNFNDLSFQEKNIIQRNQGWTMDCLKRYSTEMPAAYEVIAKMTDNNRSYFRLERYRKYVGAEGPPSDQKWRCTFSRSKRTNLEKEEFGPENEFLTQADAESAPMAICLAALGAMGVSV